MLISQNPVAKKYASAYLNIYQDSLTKHDIDNMCKAATFLKKNKYFMQLICALGIEKKEMVAVIRKLTQHFSLPESFEALIRVMIRHKKANYLLKILQDICTLYKKRNNVLELTIKTAQTLESENVTKLTTFFEKQSGMHVEARMQEEKSLIAGVRLQSALFLWECSIDQKLRLLQQKLLIEG